MNKIGLIYTKTSFLNAVSDNPITAEITFEHGVTKSNFDELHDELKEAIAKELNVKSYHLQLSLKKEENNDQKSRSNSVIVVATISYENQDQLKQIKALIEFDNFEERFNENVKSIPKLGNVKMDEMKVIEGKL